MSCVNREAIGNPVTKKPGSITLEEITASPENGSIKPSDGGPMGTKVAANRHESSISWDTHRISWHGNYPQNKSLAFCSGKHGDVWNLYINNGI
jgi:hypothetical protein